MKYEIQLNPEKIRKDYVKVTFNKKQYVIGNRKITVPQKLYEKLIQEQPDNFLFYVDGKSETTMKKVVPEKTVLEGTIEKKKNVFSKTLDKIKGE